MAVEEAQEKEVVVRVASSKVTPDELAALTSKMVIDKKSKRRAAKEEAMETDIPKISIKSKAISKSRKKDTFKRSKRQLLHWEIAHNPSSEMHILQKDYPSSQLHNFAIIK